MRVPFFLLVMALALVRCTSNGGGMAGADANASMKIPKDTAAFTDITWLDSTHRDFGTIAEGRKLDVAYRFRNSGAKPLVIERVQPSCGCTIADQPDAPVMPGAEGVIRAVFNSEGHVGVNNKTLYVYANTRGTTSNELHFSVHVEKKKW